MSMSMQDYIVRFGVEGLNNLDTAVLGVNRLKTTTTALSSEISSTLSNAARDAGVSFDGLSNVIGTKMVRSFALFQKGSTEVAGNVKVMQAAILQADGAVVKLNYNLQQLKGSNALSYVGGSGSATSVSTKTTNSTVPGAGQTSAVSSALALAGRAALTIPIWMALRTAMTSVSETATEGVKRMADLDQAVAQMSILTTGAFDPVAAKQKVDDLSLSTGKSVDEIRDVYKNLAESGLSSATSLEAMNTIVKGSMASFSDAAPLARTMAGALNVMGDSVQYGTTQAEKLNYMMNVMQTLWKSNGGQMDDYVGGLRNSAAAAETAGVSFKELMVNVATLHTGLQMGTVAGNALRMALNDLVKKQPEVLNFLGQDKLTPEQANDSETLLISVVQKMKTMQEAGAPNATILRSVNNLFGQKGGRDPLSLLALLDKYKQNMADANNVNGSSNIVGKDAQAQISTMTVQFERMHNIMADMGSNFLGGLFNIAGKDPVEILQNMNAELTKMKDGAHGFGKALHDALLPLSILVGIPLLGAGVNLAGSALGAGQVGGMTGIADKLERIANTVQTPVGGAVEEATSNLGAAAYGAGAGGIGSWLAKLAQPSAEAGIGEGTSAIGGVAGVAAGVLPAMLSAIITIAVPATIAYLATIGISAIPSKVPGKNMGDVAGAFWSDYFTGTGASLQSAWKSVTQPGYDVNKDPSSDIYTDKTGSHLKFSAYDNMTSGSNPYERARQAGLGDLGKITVTGKPKPAYPDTVPLDTLKDLTAQYDKMKQYGIDDLQIKIASLENLRQQATLNLNDADKLKVKQQIETDILEIQKAQTAEANAYASTLQKSISTNLLDSMQGKKGTPGLFTSMSQTVTKQFQTNVSDNASKLIMSTGIGSVSDGLFGAIDDATRQITSPILQAHIDGGAAVHDAILSAYGLATHQDFGGYMRAGNIPGAGSSGVASMTSAPSGTSNISSTMPANAVGSMVGPNGEAGYMDANGKFIPPVSSSSNVITSSAKSNLPGIWGTTPFSNHSVFGGSASTNIGALSQSGNWSISGGGSGFSMTSPYNTPDTGMSLGKLGAMGSTIAGSSVLIAGGVSQIAGGGAKNITQGIGSVAGGVAGGVAGMAALEGAGSGGLFAAAGVAGTATAGVAAGALAILGPIALAVGAIAIIASLFMKSSDKSTQTQTSETKVASKIDVSNQKLELINRNLLALNNTMATYALATSSYFTEKNGTIDSQFALGTARAF